MRYNMHPAPAQPLSPLAAASILSLTCNTPLMDQ
jgi:hypothetical protein